jgi:hypothetical protein
MHVFHTAGVPPRSGSIILAIIGCTTNSREELRNSVSANRKTMHPQTANRMPADSSAQTPENGAKSRTPGGRVRGSPM